MPVGAVDCRSASTTGSAGDSLRSAFRASICSLRRAAKKRSFTVAGSSWPTTMASTAYEKRLSTESASRTVATEGGSAPTTTRTEATPGPGRRRRGGGREAAVPFERGEPVADRLRVGAKWHLESVAEAAVQGEGERPVSGPGEQAGRAGGHGRCAASAFAGKDNDTH